MKLTIGQDPLIVGRTPLFPFRTIFDIYRAADPLEALRSCLSIHDVARCAIAVASPSLYAAMEAWLGGSEPRNSATPLRLLAYVARMSARPTPFGIFASIAAVSVGSSTTLTLEDDARIIHARPDMGWMLPLAREVEDDISLRSKLRVALNPAFIERAGRLYVMNSANVRRDATEGGGKIEHTPISLKKTPAVEFVLRLLEKPMLVADIVRELADHFEAEHSKAEALVDQLWQAGLFISELRPNPCGEPAGNLGDSLATIHARGPEIRTALDEVEALNGKPVRSIPAEQYGSIVEKFRAVSEDSFALQIDATHRFAGTIGATIFSDVLHLADAYVRNSRRTTLRSYREAFARKYEGNDRLIPLLELIHPDFGLGAPAELDADEQLDQSRNNELVDLATEALIRGNRVVDIDDVTYERLFPPLVDTSGVPEHFEVGFQVAAQSLAAVERGEYLIVPSNLTAAIGPGRSVGRFAGALGGDIGARIRQLARPAGETRIIAEMTYLPPSVRSLNVAQRPNPYAYEVPIGVTPGHSRVISLRDILVGIRGERFFLYSTELEREISVRESHVFNTTAGAPDLCRFLNLVGQDGARTIGSFDWGKAFCLPALPRLTHGRVVLSPMAWRAPRDIFLGSPEQRSAAVEAWRKRWDLPRDAYLRERDQWLPVDFTSPLALEMLADQLKRSNAANLEFREMLPDESAVWITRRDDTSTYITEFIANITSVSPPHGEVSANVAEQSQTRRLGPESEWLYMKLYGGAGQNDALLARHIGPLIAALKNEALIDRAFFLRYGDPDPHLRIRLRRSASATAGALFERVATVCGDLLQSGVIDRYGFDTYERELERYGGADNIDDIEEIFGEDSLLCLEMIDGTTRKRRRKIEDAIGSAGWLLDGLLDRAEYSRFLKHLGRPAQRLSIEDWEIAKAARPRYLRTPAERAGAFSRVRERTADQETLRNRILESLLHMHANRLGLDRSTEIRALGILWHICNGIVAQKSTSNGSPRASVPPADKNDRVPGVIAQEV
jgi:lantibiotic biosynthesis protein